MTNKEMKKQIIELVGRNFYETFFINSVTDSCESELFKSQTLHGNTHLHKFACRKWAGVMWERKYRELCKKVLSVPNADTETARMMVLQDGFAGGIFFGNGFKEFVMQ